MPVRHGRMMVSPFTFYRGAAKIMAADLKDTPTAGLDVQLCGDAHLSNFGVFASPERELVFDLNDFDETLPGPFEYDVKRMAASFTIAARNNGFSKADGRAATLASVKAYRESMAEFAEMRTMDIWYAHLSEQDLRARDGRRGRLREGRRPEAGDDRAEERGEGGAEGAHARQHAGALEARRARRRAIPDRQPAAGGRSAARPVEEPRLLGGGARGDGARTVPCVPGDAPRRSTPAAGAVRVGRHGPQGRGRRQCRHAGVHRPVAGSRRAGPLVPAGQGSDARRSSRITSRRAATSSPASAWCRDSGGCRRRATSSWAGRRAPRPTGSCTGDSCAT